MSKGRILIVDDEKDIRFLLREILEDEGYDVAEAAHSEAAYSDIAIKGMPDLVILDIWLENSDRDGMEILGDLKKRSKSLPVLMISGHGNIEMAVKAIKIGAYDFIEKPFNTDRLLHLVGKAFDAGRKRAGGHTKIDFVSVSTEMQSLLKAAQKAAAGEARLLINGPWGTGRRRLAQYIHQESGRAGKICTLLYSTELSVSALADALATEGSLVLCDIQNLSEAMQSELLARLNAKPEARVMATITGDAKSVLLPDLFERLGVVTLELPSLQARRADIPDLAMALVKRHLSMLGVAGQVRMVPEAATLLKQMPFLGQAAELDALCAVAAVRMASKTNFDIVPDYFAAVAAVPDNAMQDWLKTDLRTARECFEKWYFEHVLAMFDDNVSQAAVFAGMDRTAFHRKMKSLKDGDDSAEAA